MIWTLGPCLSEPRVEDCPPIREACSRMPLLSPNGQVRLPSLWTTASRTYRPKGTIT